MTRTTIMRHLEIDMGHRVTNHDGKCRNFHGHRYRIEVAFDGVVQQESGSSQGMVVDFSELKKLLADTIDARCDHALALWVEDPWVCAAADDGKVQQFNDPGIIFSHMELRQAIWSSAGSHHKSMFARVYVENVGQVYLLGVVPTAEELAEHWYWIVSDALALTQLPASVTVRSVRVWETPNTYAEFTY